MAEPKLQASLAELDVLPATEAKNRFGAMLDKVMAGGKVAITKHEEVRAVLLSAREYEALVSQQQDSLAQLHGEFTELVERMQAPRARKAGRALFDATPRKLGRTALAAARRRG
ncbi:MAG TPA: type II toxin-antitoxin system prevent-host-death family antitoxin [Polyangiaceae bacterium]|nr:type II toxin-antitoxin system prevent-host-death family antitoxin [Polyangiaceae bacterium]